MADPVSFVASQAIQFGINYLFPSKGPRIKDMKLSASSYGAAIPYAWGECRVAGNMIWADNVVEHRKKRIGKGGVSIQYSYTVSFAAAFCKGPIAQFRRIWADGKLIYDATGQSPIVHQSKYTFDFYFGTEDQVPNALMESKLGESNTPAFRGLAYVVFDNFPMTDFGNRIPQLSAEVIRDGSGSAGLVVDNVGSETFRRAVVPVGAIGEETRESYWLMGGYDDGTANLTIDIVGPKGTFSYGNPDHPGVAETQFTVNAAIWDEANAGILFFVTTSVQSWAVKWEKVSNSIVWQKPVPSDFVGKGNIKYGKYGAIVARGNSGASPPYYMSLWMLDTATGLWAYRDGWPDPNEATYAGMPITTSAILSGTDTQYFDSWNNCIVTGGSSGGHAGHVMFMPKGTDYLTATPMTQSDGSSLGDFQGGRLWVDYYRQRIYLIAIDGSGQRYLKRVRMSDAMMDDTITASDMGGEFYSIFDILPGNGDLIISQGVSNSIGIGWVDGDSYRLKSSSGSNTNDFSKPWPPVFDSPGSSAVSKDVDGLEWIIYRELFDTINVIDVDPDGQATTLYDIVADLLTQGGLTADQYDLTQLRNILVTGYGFARSTDVKSIMEELQRVYLFDLVESQGRLVAVMRGGNESFTNGLPSFTIQQNVLGSTSPEAMDFWDGTRAQDPEVPGQVELGFLNASNDYNECVARSQRVANPIPTMFSRQKVSMELSIVFTPDDAKTQAKKILYSQWAERNQHSSRLPWAYLDLDAADLISVNLNDGRNFLDRVASTEYGADGTIAIKTYSQDNGAYTIEATADGGSGAYATPTIYAPTAMDTFIINTPLLRDGDDTGGSYSLYYVAMSRATISTQDFRGGSMYRSLNNVDFDFLTGLDGEVTWGYVASALPTPRRGFFAVDWDNTITVTPGSKGFELTSISDDEFWAGGNAAYLNGEIIQFRDAVENHDGTYTLSYLLRGRRGTEYACGTHGAGENLVMLEAEPIAIAGDTLDSRGGSRFFESFDSEAQLDFSNALEIKYEPRDLMPYAPVQIQREVNSDGTVRVTWERRTRMGGEMQDYVGTVPLNEGSEKYEIYFLSAPFDGDPSRGNIPPHNIVDFLTSTTNEVSWDPVGSGIDPFLDDLHIVVYQLSSAVGRGFPGYRTIAPWAAS